jgi:archaellum component FlaC
MTRGRCRVFYKGLNRNGTYITDEFARKLIKSAPYTPVKGIYEVDDYTDHGKKRTEGRIYGIVPAEPNFAWEKHLDDGGKEREYACFDVLYYTALYEEAGEINGKSQSMELYRGTLKGSWQRIDGRQAYVFTDGCFLGLQVLGDDVEPCFEGASFYSTDSGIMEILSKYEQKVDLFQNPEQGGNIMDINFKVSDNQKHEFLFRSLNPNFNEEGGWVVDCGIVEVYDEYAIVVNYEDGSLERVFYTKDNEADTMEITGKERCFIVDVNEEEKAALDGLKTSYEAAVATLEENTNTINTLTEENSNYSIKVGELETNISTLTTERDNAQNALESLQTEYDNANATISTLTSDNETLAANYTALNETVAALTEERDALATFKKDVIDNQKKAIINTYAETLDTEVIETYMNNMDNYTCEELDMRLTYECKKANPSIFSKGATEPQVAYVPKQEPTGGIDTILARYEKK